MATSYLFKLELLVKGTIHDVLSLQKSNWVPTYF